MINLYIRPIAIDGVVETSNDDDDKDRRQRSDMMARKLSRYIYKADKRTMSSTSTTMAASTSLTSSSSSMVNDHKINVVFSYNNIVYHLITLQELYKHGTYTLIHEHKSHNFREAICIWLRYMFTAYEAIFGLNVHYRYYRDGEALIPSLIIGTSYHYGRGTIDTYDPEASMRKYVPIKHHEDIDYIELMKQPDIMSLKHMASCCSIDELDWDHMIKLIRRVSRDTVISRGVGPSSYSNIDSYDICIKHPRFWHMLRHGLWSALNYH